MRTIIHSLLGTTIANFFPGYTNYSLSIQKAFGVCKSKNRCPKKFEEKLKVH